MDNNIYNYYKSAKKIPIVISIACILLLCCNESKNKSITDYFTVTAIDTSGYLNCNSLELTSTTGKSYNVYMEFVDQHVTEDSNKIPFHKYEKIKSGQTYKLTIKEYEKYPELKFITRGLENTPLVVVSSEKDSLGKEKEVIVWKDGKFSTKVYYSENIYGNYIEIID